ncbi:hypothetical protein HDE68_004620 [Pedobacter cryoconitis]|uniref:Uncharacterized protein n=1 Tax=Pedobacter cryoconitis TaxID=188932 RepID=A0A7W8ZR48_9SPHI|nr:hypothetical protein [Pedobacter cryoconitis]
MRHTSPPPPNGPRREPQSFIVPVKQALVKGKPLSIKKAAVEFWHQGPRRGNVSQNSTAAFFIALFPQNYLLY